MLFILSFLTFCGKEPLKRSLLGAKRYWKSISKLWSLGTKRCEQHMPRLAGAIAAGRSRQGAGFGERTERNGACWSAPGNQTERSRNSRNPGPSQPQSGTQIRQHTGTGWQLPAGLQAGSSWSKSKAPASPRWRGQRPASPRCFPLLLAQRPAIFSPGDFLGLAQLVFSNPQQISFPRTRPASPEPT